MRKFSKLFTKDLNRIKEVKDKFNKIEKNSKIFDEIFKVSYKIL